MAYYSMYFDWIFKGVSKMSSEEFLENTEIMEESSEENVEAVVEVLAATQILEQIYNDVHIIMVFTIITFCMSCFRGWRRNSMKGVR